MSKFIIASIAVLVTVAPAFALPDYEQTTTYYDSSGNAIGVQGVQCTYPYYTFSGTTTGDRYVTEVGASCEQFGGFNCEDLGMASIPNCPLCSWCVSDSYMTSYYDGMVKDRNGDYCSGLGYGYSCVRFHQKSRQPQQRRAALHEIFGILRRTIPLVEL
ncbi:MAG TPA: hypothetical protein VJZ76_23520 [Thermoanaerobaculia bacterium]|nr:hypothetical protein [Thermoanaerobaculia bacterium]